MGIGKGIVTKSAMRKKQWAEIPYRRPSRALPAIFFKRKRYTVVAKFYKRYNIVNFWPHFSLRELLSRDLRDIKRQMTQDEFALMFCLSLCNRSEHIRIREEVPKWIEKLADEYVEKHPKWAPENNRLRWYEMRFPVELCVTQ